MNEGSEIGIRPKEVPVPSKFLLPEPYRPVDKRVVAPDDFRALAYERYQILPQGEYDVFCGMVGKERSPVATFFVGRPDSSFPGISSLGVTINGDAFSERDADLIPIASEHEIQEAWLETVRPGFSGNHDSARVHEYKLALQEGKAVRLLHFHTRINPALESDLKMAFNKARMELKREGIVVSRNQSQNDFR